MTPEDQEQIRSIIREELGTTVQSITQATVANISDLRTEMSARFDDLANGLTRIEAANLRNTKVLTAGSKAIAAFQAWAEKRDQMDAKRDKEISDLRARLAKLERRHPRAS